MNEAETQAELIDPKLKDDGWDHRANSEVEIQPGHTSAIAVEPGVAYEENKKAKHKRQVN